MLALLVVAGCGGGESPRPTQSPDAASTFHVVGAYRVVLDPSGNLVVPDGSARRVWRVDLHSGRVAVLAGDGRSTLSGLGGPAAQAGLGLPRDAAVGPDGTIYIVVSSDQLLRVGADGLLAVAAGTGQKGPGGDGGPAPAAQLDGPTAVAVDQLGNVYIAEAAGRVRRIDGRTSVIRTVGPAFDQPHGLAAAADGSVYVAETGANRVRRLAPDGAITTVEAGQLSMPTGVTLTSGGDVLIADFGNNRVRRVSATGVLDTLVEPVVGPTGVAVAADGSIYISRLDSGVVRIDRSGRQIPIG